MMGNKAQKAKAPKGFDSLGAAVRAWCFEGVEPMAQAELAGVSYAGIYYHIQKLKREGGQAAEVVAALLTAPADRRRKGERRKAIDTRGIWTPEKLSKAHRLFGKTMLMIAEALEVPPKELLEYGLKGVLPPMGKGQRVAQLLEDHSGEQPPPPEDPAIVAERRRHQAAIDAELEADELRLERESDAGKLIQGEPIAEDQFPPPAVPPEPEPEAPRRYRLTDGAGRYLLNPPEKGMTLNRALAWVGSPKAMEDLFRRLPATKELDPERLPDSPARPNQGAGHHA
jgi:hypothetical protein